MFIHICIYVSYNRRQHRAERDGIKVSRELLPSPFCRLSTWETSMCACQALYSMLQLSLWDITMRCPHFLCLRSALGLGTVQRVSDSIPPSSPSCVSDWVRANAEGQVESCSRGRSAGVSPVSLPQRSLVDAAWQEAAEALPFFSPYTRCQSSRALQ